MRFRHLALTCAMVLAATLAAPALAHDGHRHHPGDRPDGPDMRPVWKGDHSPRFARGYGPDFGRIREDWLIECHARVVDRGAPAGPDACETALDDYFRSYGPGYGPGVIMVPVTIPGRPCVETVTTEYVRPAHRAIPRPAPRRDKRIRVTPDKRVPVQ